MNMKVKSKVWLDKDGKLVFGTGNASIIKAVSETGSLNRAAKKLNMSCRHVWSCIKSVEKRIGQPLLIKTKGGKDGGGAVLTDKAKMLLEKFEILEKDIKHFVDKRFEEIFYEKG